MKKIASLLTTLMILIAISTPINAAEKRIKEVPEENFAYTDIDDKYWAKFVASHPEYIHEFVVGKRLGDYSISGFLKYDNSYISNDISWDNPDQIIVPGIQTVQIKAKFEGKELILTGEIEGIILDESPTTPSLTANKVTLLANTAYDINLINKVSGSKYKWVSSNPEIAKVNEKNGLVTAISEGEAVITCEITLPDGTMQTLKSIVTVGYDENAPVLSETELELEIGDKFTITVENLTKGSKVSWKSSDKSVVKISSTKGKITAVGPGQAYITCTITTPDRQVIVLRCDISVTEPTE